MIITICLKIRFENKRVVAAFHLCHDQISQFSVELRSKF